MNNINALNKSEKTWPLMLLFFTSTDTVMFGTNSMRAFLYVPRIVGLAIVIYVLLRSRGILYFDKKYIIIPLVMVIIICISSYINQTEFGTYISRLIAVLTAFFVVSYYKYEDFVKAFDRSMYLVAVVAIITELCAYAFPSVIMALPKVTNSANNTFSYFMFGGIQLKNLGHTLIRSSSIFWEPGAFAIYLIIAIYMQLFSKEKPNLKRIMAYIICLLITFSTTGYISFIVLLIAYLISSKKSYLSKRIKLLAIISLLLIGVMIIFGENTLLYNFLFKKIINRESTAVTRYASIINGLEIGWDHPLFGVSPNNMRKYMVYYAQKSSFNFGANPMNTNTVTYQFAAYGLLFGVFFTLGTYKFFKQHNESLLCSFLLFLMILLAYCGEAFYSYLPFLIVFYGYNKNLIWRSNYK